MKKGFTLIELLIVITIIGVLAVAFLPQLLGAPSKARDTQRIADLQRISGVMINISSSPDSWDQMYSNCFYGITDDLGSQPFWSEADFGGSWPADPDVNNELPTHADFTDPDATCTGSYGFILDPNGGDPATAPQADEGTYAFGLYAHVENMSNANSVCSSAYAGDITTQPTTSTDASDLCYSILVQ